MAKKIYIYDSILLNPDLKKQWDKDQKLHMIDSFVRAGTGVEITVRATHAARITRNNGLYLPTKMRDGIKSFVSKDGGGTSSFNKPVLTEHNTYDAPLGRVVAAEYIDTSGEVFGRISDKYSDVKDAIAALPTMNRMWQAVDAVESLVHSGLLFSKDFQGLGFGRTTLQVTDSDAMTKVLDGRYQTVSTRAATDAAVCSCCKTDWVSDGRCEHDVGEMVDGAPMFLIAGNLSYEEVSFVNIPADSEAVSEGVRIVDLHENAEEITPVYTDNLRSTPYELLSITDSAGVVDGIQQANTDVLDGLSVSDKEEKEVEVKQMTDTQSCLLDLYKDLHEGREVNWEDAFDGETMMEQRALLRFHDGLHWEWDNTVREEDEWSLSRKEQMPTDVYKVHAKLHAILEEKGLRGAMINGPLDQFSIAGEDTGEYVLVNKDSKEDDLDMELSDLLKRTSEFEIEDLKDAITQLTSAVEEKEKVAKAPDLNTLVDKLAALEEQVSQLATQLTAQEGLTDSADEQLEQISGEYKTLLADHVSLLQKLNGTEGGLEAIKDSLKEKNVQELKDSVGDLLKTACELEILKTEKAEVVLDDPTLAQDGKKAAKTVDNLDRWGQLVVERYTSICDDQDEEAALNYVDSMMKRGFIDSGFDIKDYLTDKENS